MAYRLTFYGSDNEVERVIEDADEAHTLWDRTVAAMTNGVSDYSRVTFADGGWITKQHAVPLPEPEPEPVAEEKPKVVTKKR